MGRSNVRVIVRARPTASYASNNFQFNEASDSIDIRLPKDDNGGVVNNQQESWHFKLDKVMANASQEQVFDSCAGEVVRSVMDGYNGTILAYGQTGAGKTHTMTGGHVGFADRGIVPRSISQIYAEAAARPENNITIRLSYCEIYNELMFDLLTEVGVAEQSGDLHIFEDAKGSIHVKGLSCPTAGTEEEALHIFFQGDTNRHVAEHALNKGSTRSHCVFTIHVESRSRVESNEKVIFSKLHLVDLAGSERVKKTGTDGVTLKEASYINKSLSFLEQVVVALGDKHRDHVPYRQSKLTHMLKDSLGGNCKTTMVANIWPEAKMLEETTSTLRFATRMMRVSNEATVNVHLDPQLLVRKYERQIKELKQELAMHNTLANRSQIQYEEYTPDESRELESKVQRYLEGEIQELEVGRLRGEGRSDRGGWENGPEVGLGGLSKMWPQAAAQSSEFDEKWCHGRFLMRRSRLFWAPASDVRPNPRSARPNPATDVLWNAARSCRWADGGPGHAEQLARRVAAQLQSAPGPRRGGGRGVSPPARLSELQLEGVHPGPFIERFSGPWELHPDSHRGQPP